MSPSGSCVRCQRVLVVDSASGLCPSCERSTGVGEPEATATAFPRERTSFSPPVLAAPHAPTDEPTQTFEGAADPELAIDEPLARRLPPGYDPLDVLGQGGMGLVLKAWERAAERIVAVKLIRAVPDREALKRFRIEAKALASLKHPNLVQVLTVAMDGPDPYFTMEYVEGCGLDRRLKQEGALPVAEAVRVIEAAARGVAAAHTAGILHRDLKPGNILLAADGTPKVTDFGLAKRLDRDPELTPSGAIVGTPSYIAPEQAGRKNCTVAEPADVYSLGATLYHLLTGRPPFRGENQLETLDQVLRKPVISPRQLRPDLPADLEAVVMKCLEKDPHDRYPTAHELAEDLARIRSGDKPIGPAAWSERAWRTIRRQWKGIAGAAAVIALVAALVAVWPKTPRGPVLPPDALAEIQSQLQNGKPVTLVGKTGPPRYFRFPLSPSQIGESPLPEDNKACTFQGINLTLLELLSDPGVTAYRVTIELRQIDGFGRKPHEPVGPDRIGFYFGADEHTAGNLTATTLYVAQFQDYVPVPVPEWKGPLIQQAVKLSLGAILQRPDMLPAPSLDSTVAKALPFAPAPGRIGLWRRFDLEVRPQWIKLGWFDPANGQDVLIADWTAEEIRARTDRVQSMVNAGTPGAGFRIRPWRPQLAFGVWCQQSIVSIRNVEITPLK